MELPTELKNLYRHWEHHIHVKSVSTNVIDVCADEQLYASIMRFVEERLSIWHKKQTGEVPPHTSDVVLATYRFCNVFREFDRQTIEFHTLLKPLRNNFPLWLLNMFYCRMVARPQTIRDVGLLSFSDAKNVELYKRLMAYERPRYGTPYVFPVSVIMRSNTPTRELFMTQYLPKIMEEVSQEIEMWHTSSVTAGVGKITPLFGFNLRFLWTEVLIDVAYQFPEKISLFKTFPIGPGALPTFKKINPHLDVETVGEQLANLGVESCVRYNGSPLILSAENWEGIGCEYRKYTNLQQGRGRKRLFR